MTPMLSLGAVEPPDQKHVEIWPATKVLGAGRPGRYVKRKLWLPNWHERHDQGNAWACVLHGICLQQAINNGVQTGNMNLRYDPMEPWHWCRLNDGLTGNDDLSDHEQGTTARAGYDYVRQFGLAQVTTMRLDGKGIPYSVGKRPLDLNNGITANRWLGTLNLVDEMREAIHQFRPITFATGWRDAWFRLVRTKDRKGLQWPSRSKWGQPGPGHLWLIYGADDDLECFFSHGSWNCREYPHHRIPYSHVEKIERDGWYEASVVTDR